MPVFHPTQNPDWIPQLEWKTLHPEGGTFTLAQSNPASTGSDYFIDVVKKKKINAL